jgi:hypothetical protein
MGLGLLLLAAACQSRETPALMSSGGSGDITTTNPRPVVQITPWTPPPPNDPIVLGVTISNKGGHAFSMGSAPNESKVVVTALDSGGIALGTKTVPFDPSAWGDGSHSVDLKDTAELIRKGATVSFEITIHCQLGTDPPFTISDKEP